MNDTVFLAVLASAALHATWNLFAKTSTDHKAAVLAVGWGLLGLLLLPIALWTSDGPALASTPWLLVVGTGVVHAGYILLLGWAYTLGDISVVYPVARGIGVAGTALWAFTVGGRTAPWTGALAIGAVVAGTFLIAASGERRRPGREVAAGVAVGLTIATYSTLDGTAAPETPLLVLLAGMNLLASVVAMPWLLWRARGATVVVLRTRKLRALSIAAAGSLAYLVILWAFRQSPAPYVVALREVAIVFAAALGVLVLKEPIGVLKLGGIAAIAAGAVLLRSGG